jgi:flavin reductase (DIM6/NTAB) family NADH-FMN oxidoreductase RutF
MIPSFVSRSAAPPDPGEPGARPDQTEFDQHRRRVLWALPSGLYLIGSRHHDAVNLMTANLVIQVCLEPKLVAVALERESRTAAFVSQDMEFAISLLHRSDRDVVRRFVKPVADDRVVRHADGTVRSMAGHDVTEVGSDRLPVLASAAGYIVCSLVRREELGSHVLCIGEVTEVGGEPDEVLRMEDTRMHYGG